MEEYLLYPRSVTTLSSEIKKICDDYWEKKINRDELSKIIGVWAEGSMLFYDNNIDRKNINKSIKKIVGSKRLELMFNVLGI